MWIPVVKKTSERLLCDVASAAMKVIDTPLVLSGCTAGSYCSFAGGGGQFPAPPLASFHLSEMVMARPPWPIFRGWIFLKLTWISRLAVPASPGTRQGNQSPVVISCSSSMDYLAIGRASPSSVWAVSPRRHVLPVPLRWA